MKSNCSDIMYTYYLVTAGWQFYALINRPSHANNTTGKVLFRFLGRRRETYVKSNVLRRESESSWSGKSVSLLFSKTKLVKVGANAKSLRFDQMDRGEWIETERESNRKWNVRLAISTPNAVLAKEPTYTEKNDWNENCGPTLYWFPVFLLPN